MASVPESKVDCVVRFSHDLARTQLSPPLPGLIHLFEHKYDQHIGGFWYGVIELACSVDDIAPSMAKPQEGVRVFVTLADGRTGVARHTRGHIRSQDGQEIYRLAVVGIIPLGGVSGNQ